MSDSAGEFRQLIERVLAGDRSAGERLFAKYRSLVRLLVVGMLQRNVLVRVDESDVTQETMRKAVADLRQFGGTTEAEFVDWLKAVLRHTVLNLVRDHKAQKRDVDRTLNESYSSAMGLAENCAAHSSEDPQRRASRNELLVQLARALEELTASQRLAVELDCLQGMKVDDIAVAMDKTPDAVAGLLYRGKQKLRRLMVPHDRGPGEPEAKQEE